MAAMAVLAAGLGILFGQVLEAKTSAPVAGVTVVAEGPEGERAELTDEDGKYSIAGLPAGLYIVRFYYANLKVEQPGVRVDADGMTMANAILSPRAVDSEPALIAVVDADDDDAPPADQHADPEAVRPLTRAVLLAVPIARTTPWRDQPKQRHASKPRHRGAAGRARKCH